jgi:hypothetical protein
MFADISLAKAPSTSTPELMRAEYEWAHSVCNGPKMMLFLSKKYGMRQEISRDGRLIYLRLKRY